MVAHAHNTDISLRMTARTATRYPTKNTNKNDVTTATATATAPARTSTSSTPSSSSSSLTPTAAPSSNDALRWRSTGWTPLGYPASALLNGSTASNGRTNALFPLDRDVLRAAMRELLILEGSLDFKTLQLKENNQQLFAMHLATTTTTRISTSITQSFDKSLTPVTSTAAALAPSATPPSPDSPFTLQQHQSYPAYARHVHPWLVRVKDCAGGEAAGGQRRESIPRRKRKLSHPSIKSCSSSSSSSSCTDKKKKKRTRTTKRNSPPHQPSTDNVQRLEEPSQAVESPVEPQLQQQQQLQLQLIPLQQDRVEELQISIPCAEQLVDLIVDRARLLSDKCSSILEPVLSSSDVKEDNLFNSLRPPRKVSDADQVPVSNIATTMGSAVDQPPVLLDLTDETCGDEDISLFVDLHSRNDDGSLTFLKSEIPSFLDVSIVFESILRIAGYRMVCQMCHTFDDEAIRLFLGYKSCALKRERVLRILSDYLFDVSHAMFAWKQTESEIVSDGLPASFHYIDSIVAESLFDERALKKIGGLDDASLLRHAIEISRCERKKESWERFSQTARGRRLLSHHRSGRAHLVGQKRRGQRMKRTAVPSPSPFSNSITASTAIDASDAPFRSRASSIASHDEDIPEASPSSSSATASTASTTSMTCSRSDLNTDGCTGSVTGSVTGVAGSNTIQSLSEVLELRLIREEGKSWGVLLSREGDHCVVDRAPAECSLRCGDMILSVNDWRPDANAKNAPGWFQEIVGFFKNSHELHLIVRRVGSW